MDEKNDLKFCLFIILLLLLLLLVLLLLLLLLGIDLYSCQYKAIIHCSNWAVTIYMLSDLVKD
jgi:hypothetical protein